jgi:hypothetical protein
MPFMQTSEDNFYAAIENSAALRYFSDCGPFSIERTLALHHFDAGRVAEYKCQEAPQWQQ